MVRIGARGRVTVWKDQAIVEVRRRVTGHGVALLGIVLAGALLRFTGIADQALWGDEAITDLLLGYDDLKDFLFQVDALESAPPPYYLCVFVWTAVFGDGDAALRSFSAVLGTLTIPVMYLAVAELGSRRAGLIAAALTAASPILVWYSQEARAYALYVFLVAVSFWLFARALRDTRFWVLAAWGLASAAALSSYYLAALLVALETAVLLWLARGRRRSVLLATVPIVVAGALLLPYALEHRDLQEWISGLPFGERFTQTLELFLVGNSDPARIAVVAAAVVALAALTALVLHPDKRERRGGLIALAIGAVGLGAAVLGRSLDADYLLARNVLFAWVPLAAAVAIGLGSRPLRLAGPLAAGLLCALGVWLVLEVKRDERLQRADMRTAAELIGDPPKSGPRIILAGGSFLSTALRSYLPGVEGPVFVSSGGSDATLPPSAEVVVLNQESPGRGDLCWWGGACGLSGTVPEVAPPGYHLVERDSAELFRLTRYRSARPLTAQVYLGPGTASVYRQED